MLVFYFLPEYNTIPHVPNHFVICTKIRRLYTFKAIICRISCQKNPGCRQRKIRIISCIRCQCSVCILCKTQHRIFNLFCIIFYIFRLVLNESKSSSSLTAISVNVATDCCIPDKMLSNFAFVSSDLASINVSESSVAICPE